MGRDDYPKDDPLHHLEVDESERLDEDPEPRPVIEDFDRDIERAKTDVVDEDDLQ